MHVSMIHVSMIHVPMIHVSMVHVSMIPVSMMHVLLLLLLLLLKVWSNFVTYFQWEEQQQQDRTRVLIGWMCFVWALNVCINTNDDKQELFCQSNKLSLQEWK